MDLIDKRNQREKIARSIIKRRNVIYSPMAYTGAADEGVSAGQGAAREAMAAPGTGSAMAAPGAVENAEAAAVLERLQKEAAADEAAKQAEIQKAIQQRDERELAISRILNEKENSRQQAMAQARGSN